jgi:hypothetical protein
MEIVRFRIAHGDGRIEELMTEAPRVLIGSGSHCEIRLPIGAARVEHVLIQSTPVGWRATARSFDPPPTLDGIEFAEAPVRGDCVVAIGKTRIEVRPSTTLEAGQHVARAPGTRNPRVVLYLLLGLGCWVALRAAGARTKTAAHEPTQVPSLWSSAPASCPEAAPEPAVAVATARMSLALAKRERSPFRADDGVAAVPLYESAAACFRLAGRTADADDAAAAASRLRQDLSDRFNVHRLRLQRGLASEEWVAAEHEIASLLAFLPSDGGEYVTWLSNLRRRLQIQYGTKSKDKA